MKTMEPREPKRWIDVAGVKEIPAEGAIERVVEGQLVALFQHAGAFYALEALCAHHGGPLAEGTVHDGCVTCPWHGWTYRLADGTQQTSGQKLIQSYPLKETNGRLEIGWPE